MRKAYLARYAQFPMDKLSVLLGCDDVEDCAEICAAFELEVTMVEMVPTEVALYRNSTFNGRSDGHTGL